MNGTEASEAFLRDVASRHFVCLSYWARHSGTAPHEAKKYFASCFVVEIEQHWLLVTAGHVISGIQEAIASGAVFSDFNLHDKLAGNTFPFSVPIPFDVKDWVVLDGDPQGADYAAAPLSNLIVQNLHAGGVRPIGESVFGIAPFDQYPHWLLAGTRNESFEVVGGRDTLKLTLIPLAPSTAPEGVVDSGEGHRVFAKMLSRPDLDAVQVTDVRGMSGGPIFGLRECGGEVRYWLMGLQSSWYPDSRIVCFCPILRFFAAIKEAIRMTRADPSLLEAFEANPDLA